MCEALRHWSTQRNTWTVCLAFSNLHTKPTNLAFRQPSFLVVLHEGLVALLLYHGHVLERLMSALTLKEQQEYCGHTSTLTSRTGSVHGFTELTKYVCGHDYAQSSGTEKTCQGGEMMDQLHYSGNKEFNCSNEGAQQVTHWDWDCKRVSAYKRL